MAGTSCLGKIDRPNARHSNAQGPLLGWPWDPIGFFSPSNGSGLPVTFDTLSRPDGGPLASQRKNRFARRPPRPTLWPARAKGGTACFNCSGGLFLCCVRTSKPGPPRRAVSFGQVVVVTTVQRGPRWGAPQALGQTLPWVATSNSPKLTLHGLACNHGGEQSHFFSGPGEWKMVPRPVPPFGSIGCLRPPV